MFTDTKKTRVTGDRLAWGARVSPAFRDLVFELCRGFEWTDDHANWVMACMAFETGGTFQADARNLAGSGTVGLLQFSPAAVLAMGSSTLRLAAMSPETQLEYVRKFFRPYRRRIKSLPDMYMAILMPKMTGASPHAMLSSRGEPYRKNSGIERGNDGMVTKLDAAEKVQERLKEGLMCNNLWVRFPRGPEPVPAVSDGS